MASLWNLFSSFFARSQPAAPPVPPAAIAPPHQPVNHPYAPTAGPSQPVSSQRHDPMLQHPMLQQSAPAINMNMNAHSIAMTNSKIINKIEIGDGTKPKPKPQKDPIKGIKKILTQKKNANNSEFLDFQRLIVTMSYMEDIDYPLTGPFLFVARPPRDIDALIDFVQRQTKKHPGIAPTVNYKVLRDLESANMAKFKV